MGMQHDRHLQILLIKTIKTGPRDSSVSKILVLNQNYLNKNSNVMTGVCKLSMRPEETGDSCSHSEDLA